MLYFNASFNDFLIFSKVCSARYLVICSSPACVPSYGVTFTARIFIDIPHALASGTKNTALYQIVQQVFRLVGCCMQGFCNVLYTTMTLILPACRASSTAFFSSSFSWSFIKFYFTVSPVSVLDFFYLAGGRMGAETKGCDYV